MLLACGAGAAARGDDADNSGWTGDGRGTGCAGSALWADGNCAEPAVAGDFVASRLYTAHCFVGEAAGDGEFGEPARGLRGGLIVPMAGETVGTINTAMDADDRETMRAYINVLGVAVDAIDMEGALARVRATLQSGTKGYVCAVDVNGVLAALRNDAIADAYERAMLALPDGTPTAWVGRMQGLQTITTVTGPDLMREIFSRPCFAGYSHFFYGGKPGVAEELAATLCRAYPWTTVAGSYTPPFRDLNSSEEAELIETIRRCKPDMVWVGIGAPRQELFMRRMLPHLETRLMFGVGAAFDFLTGRVRMCPPWMKRAGLHWLHRLAQDPARLWKRNLRNTAFLWHIALQMAGVRRYALRNSAER